MVFIKLIDYCGGDVEVFTAYSATATQSISQWCLPICGLHQRILVRYHNIPWQPAAGQCYDGQSTLLSYCALPPLPYHYKYYSLPSILAVQVYSINTTG